MPEIDRFRTLTEEWDALETRRASAAAEVVATREDLAKKEAALSEVVKQRDTAQGNAQTAWAKVTELAAELERLKNPPEPVPIPTKPEFLWADDFEGLPTDVRDGGTYLVDAPGGSFAIVQLGPAAHALEVSCRSDQPLDANGTRRRSEFGLPELGASSRIYRRDRYGLERWYACSLRFLDNFEDSSKVVVMQWHGGKPDPTDPPNRNPPLSLEWWSKANRLRFVQAPFEATDRKILWELTGIDPTKWYRFVVHASWSAKSDGLLRLYLDGAKVHESAGQNAYDDQDAWVFFRLGAYWPQATDPTASYPPGSTHRVDFARLRLGDEKNKLEDFA